MKLFPIIFSILIFYIISYYIPIIGYPIVLLVTFLHELGHSFIAIITGGGFHGMTINSNGSGLAITSGGVQGLVLMGGYIGSALFGSLFVIIGTKYQQFSKLSLYILIILMFVIGIIFSNTIITTIILLLFSVGFFFVVRNTNLNSYILTILGYLSLFHIISDFNVGPSSDISKFHEIIPLIPTFIYMYSWLIIVLLITFYTAKNTFNNNLGNYKG